MRVLLTRPIDDARASAGRLRALGHQVVLLPVIETGALPFVLPRQAFDAVALTSAHAAAALPPADIARLVSLPAFAVGARSAAAARAAGFARVEAGEGDERALAARLQARLPRGASVLYLAGRERKGALEALLAAAGLRCMVVETYDAVAAPALSPEAKAALMQGALDAALHYSARSARLLFELAQAANLAARLTPLRHLCLSADIALALPQAVHARAEIAAAPNEAALLALLAHAPSPAR